MNDDDLGHLIAFLHLADFGAVRTRVLLDLDRASPGAIAEAWQRCRSGRPPHELLATSELATSWATAARGLDPGELFDRHRAFGVVITIAGDAAHPSDHQDDPHVPPMLFWSAPPPSDGLPRVAIVGTRRATRYGLDLAHEFGRSLSEAHLRVVSGLALGIDAAAHSGALAAADAPPVAVVACGLDRIYPRRNRELWRAVARAGVIVSEVPLGTAPLAWRFPARNRIIAALCGAVVVVESHERGGSLITARYAGDRGVPVLAVPGSVRSPASLGTNQLIADGCAPCLGVDDVLMAIGLCGDPHGRPGDGVPAGLDPELVAVLSAMAWEPVTLEDLASRVDIGVAALTVALARLQDERLVAALGGRYERRTGSSGPR